MCIIKTFFKYLSPPLIISKQFGREGFENPNNKKYSVLCDRGDKNNMFIL